MAENKKCWSQTVGPHGFKIRVGERRPGGKLSVFWIDNKGKRQKRALGHRDKSRAKREALELSHMLAKTAAAGASIEPVRVTLRRLADLYLEDGLHGRTERHRQDTGRNLRTISAFLGWERQVSELTRADFERYEEARRTGRVVGVGGKTLGKVGANTVRHDFVALHTAISFVLTQRDAHGRRLLDTHPMDGFKLPREVSPAQPVARLDRYLALREVADQVPVQFALVLDLEYATGHRIDAILKLRWEDISFEPGPSRPLGAILWRRENDKIDNEHEVAMSQTAHDALKAALRARGEIGPGLVFPSASDPEIPVARRLAYEWLRKAQRKAGLVHLKGGGWHAFRRGWASARRHLSIRDVAAAGGWKDTDSLLKSYMQPDPETIWQVVSEPDQRRLVG